MSKKAVFKIRNSREYIARPIPNVGGGNKDFFEGNDEGFAKHKADLIIKASEVSSEIGKRDCQNFATMKVELRDDAIAKTHRPTKALFNDKYPVIGGGELGELYVQVNSKSLPQLVERLSQAKVKSEIKFNLQGKIESKVGILRSEVSAINCLSIYTGTDKCELTDYELVKYIVNDKKELIVELFSPVESQTLRDSEIEAIKYSFLSKIKNDFSGFQFVPESKYFSDDIICLVPYDIVSDVDVYQLVKFLKLSPVVKLYYPAPTICYADSHKDSKELIGAFPQPAEGVEYAKVALIDSGIRSKKMNRWIKNISDSLGDEYASNYHADEMASILIGAKYLNKFEYLEDDGCDLYDIWLPSSANSFDDHFDSILEFTDWLYLEVQTAKENGYRVFSMSINFKKVVSSDEYSLIASRLDEISQRLDVIFVIPTGNLDSREYRPEWPVAEDQVFKMLARYQFDDRLLQPADSVSAITVGSINHIGNQLICYGAPTRYTRRGPATAYGIKPDVVHVGGIGDFQSSGVVTLNGLDQLEISSHGTSISAPHIAKTIASVDMKSKSNLSTNTLKAILLHNSSIPKALNSKELNKEARDFVGFGFPECSENIVEKGESSFTFIFEESLKRGQVAEFNFAWPESLVTKSGKCKGRSRMSLVYSPPIDRSFGQEYIRANVDASLQQENIKDDEHKFNKQVHSIWDTKLGVDNNYEQNLIKHGFKWWPSKVYERESKGGFGNSINWRLKVTSQVRDGVEYPEEGISFSVVVTIDDPSGKSNKVYDELRRNLLSIGAEIQEVTIREEVRT